MPNAFITIGVISLIDNISFDGSLNVYIGFINTSKPPVVYKMLLNEASCNIFFVHSIFTRNCLISIAIKRCTHFILI